MATIHSHPSAEGGKPPPGSASAAVVIAVLLVAALAAFGWYVANLDGAKPLDLGEGAKLLPSPRPVSPFQLTDHEGRPFDRDSLLGDWTLLFFGYTYCPDICPITLQTLGRVESEWDSRDPDTPEPPRVVFVSVDPERDTIERLREYVAFFDPAFLGATGDQENLTKLSRSVGVYFEKTQSQDATDDPEGYLVDHSAQLYLVDPLGRLRAVLDDPHDPAEFAALVTTIQTRGNES